MWAELIRMRNFKNRGPQSFFGPESTESLSFCNEDSVEEHVRHSRNTGKERPQRCLRGVGGLSRRRIFQPSLTTGRSLLHI